MRSQLVRHLRILTSLSRRASPAAIARASWAELPLQPAASRGGKSATIRLHALPHPIHYRPGTSDVSILNQVFGRREYEIRWREYARRLDAHYRALVDQGKEPVIVDAGANIGLASIWFARHFPRARIYAVEPEPANFAILQRNAAPYEEIIPVHAAISDRNVAVSLSNPGGQPWGWETSESDDGEVAAVTVPELLARRPHQAPLIVKLDIEGFEVELFRSNTGWADDVPAIIWEDHDAGFHWRGTAHAILSVLTRVPRDYVRRGENTFAFSHALLALAGANKADSAGSGS
ncbi:FkbM family methyltransferase [Lutibaculum baratangense]|uniref:Methyltransferase FkbM n=1 Tax=Lutibaculum baratangense AMV1 TaxID=631454 RepID=V4RJK3_9HYPH|nr:FkbM family methyltransferase [Lutibaculum baratangense]ESR25504.1 Methyltransferase FkbM [Lutibaculum baratangense AMV1]